MVNESANELNSQQIMQKLQKMPKKTLEEKADEFLKKQNLNRYNGLIEHMAAKNNGNYADFNDSWAPIIWQANENNKKTKVVISGQDIKVYDMDYYIAESLQHIQAEQSPEAEYYDWIHQEKKLEENMVADGTSLQELHERSDFVALMDERETELKRIISLYAGAAFNSNCEQQSRAQEKLKFLTFKLSELRRLRERAQNIKVTPQRHNEIREQQKFEEQTYNNSVTAQNTENEIPTEIKIAGAVAALHMINPHHPEISTPHAEILPEDDLENSDDPIAALERKRMLWRQRILKLSGRHI